MPSLADCQGEVLVIRRRGGCDQVARRLEYSYRRPCAFRGALARGTFRDVMYPLVDGCRDLGLCPAHRQDTGVRIVPLLAKYSPHVRELGVVMR